MHKSHQCWCLSPDLAGSGRGPVPDEWDVQREPTSPHGRACLMLFLEAFRGVQGLEPGPRAPGPAGHLGKITLGLIPGAARGALRAGDPCVPGHPGLPFRAPTKAGVISVYAGAAASPVPTLCVCRPLCMSVAPGVCVCGGAAQRGCAAGSGFWFEFLGQVH